MPIYLQHGNMIDYVPPTDMTTDDVVFIGGLVGIPQFPMKSGQAGSLSVDGIYQFDKKEGVAVNFGDVVKYCGTTKLAQDSNADLTLGVAVADAEADDFGVKVKINSVLPSSGGGGGGGEPPPLSFGCGLAYDAGELIVATSCGLDFNTDGGLIVRVANGCGIDFNEYGELVASGGGGGEIGINPNAGLEFDCSGMLAVKIGKGLEFGCGGALSATEVFVGCGLVFTDHGQLVVSYGGGLDFNGYGQLMLKVCTASGLSIDNDGYLTYNG